MIIDNIQYQLPSNDKPLDLEKWMLFGYYLGRVLKEYEKPMNIYLSVPSNLLISYFAVLGSVDYDFSMTDDLSKIKESYMNLNKGNLVLYFDDKNWKSCYVYSVEKHLINKQLMAVKILYNQKTVIYVPEGRWLTHLRILNEEVNKIKNARVMKNVSNLADNIFLEYFYNKESIRRCEVQNRISATVITNKREWLNSVENIQFSSPVGTFLLNEFIYDGNSTTFKNVQVISSINSFSTKNDNDDLVLFMGANRALTKMDDYLQSKRLFIVDRHESKESINNLKDKIEYEFINNSSTCLNHILLKKLSGFGYEVPKGVEVFVWE